MSSRQAGARFGPATAVTELNDATANDIQPNVRADGLEVVLQLEPRRGRSAGRTSGSRRGARSRAVVDAGQPRPRRQHGAAETRPSLSRDGKQLLFGRSPGPEGSSDIYVTTR